MYRKACFLFLFTCLCVSFNAYPKINGRDSLLTILKINNPKQREEKLILYIRYYFNDVPPGQLDEAKADLDQLLIKNKVENNLAVRYFVETIYQMQLQHNDAAENALIKAISLADKQDDHYLLYACFTHLAFLQTYHGNTIEAVSSFRMAKKEANTLNDPYLQVLINVNISDIYDKNHLFSQSLAYLNQAMALINHMPMNSPILIRLVRMPACCAAISLVPVW